MIFYHVHYHRAQHFESGRIFRSKKEADRFVKELSKDPYTLIYKSGEKLEIPAGKDAMAKALNRLIKIYIPDI